MKNFLFPSRIPLLARCKTADPPTFSKSPDGERLPKRSPIKRRVSTAWTDCSRPTGSLSLCQGASYDYDRSRHLPSLLHLFPEEAEKLEIECPGILIKRLKSALRAERRRGQSGHWRYSLSRHIGLSRALAAELSLLETMTNTSQHSGKCSSLSGSPL